MTRAIFIPFCDGAPVPSEARVISISIEPVMKRQKDALDFIRSFISEHGYAPSYREIGEAIGVGRSRVAAIVRGLDKRGHIRRLPGKARAIEVAGAAA